MFSCKDDIRKAEGGNMENVKKTFLQGNFSLREIEVWLIDRTQYSDTTNSEFYWRRALRTSYPDGLDIENDY